MAAQSFVDALSDIDNREAAPETEEQKPDTTDAAPPSGSPAQESRPDADKPSGDPSPKPEDPPTPESAAPAAEEPPPAQEPAKPDPNEVIVFGDFKGTRAELEAEWERRGFRQDDYTRKSQERERRAKEVEAEWESRRTLANDIARDPAITKFLAAHPEALPLLMEDPAATRKNLLGNAQAVDEYWQDYEVLAENPRLAQRFVAQDATPEEVTEESQRAVRRQATLQVAETLAGAVAEVAKQFPGVKPEEVQDYLLELGGVDPKNPPKDEDSAYAAFRRLYGMMFVQVGDDDLRVDTKLIRDRFEYLSARKSLPDPQQSAAERHNAQVDAALKQDEPPPVAPRGGAPTVSEQAPKQYDDIQAVLQDI